MKPGFIFTVSGLGVLAYSGMLACAKRYDFDGEIFCAALVILPFAIILRAGDTRLSFRDAVGAIAIVIAGIGALMPGLWFSIGHMPGDAWLGRTMDATVYLGYCLAAVYLFTGFTLLLSYENPFESLREAVG